MGYDDWGRLINDNCVNSGGTTIWSQAFSYDQYDNITKTGTISWACSTCYDQNTNRYNSTLSGNISYDASGDLLDDTFHTYTWNQFNKLNSVDSSACGTNGECVTYDAFGRAVEISKNAAYTAIWYTQLGKTAYMTGSTINYAYWPSPGAGSVVVNGNVVNLFYVHRDWLGNARVTSFINAHSVNSDQAYAPYGEIYNEFGSTLAEYQMFTGDTQDIVSGTMETPNREYNSASQGRWLAPDPGRTGWNQYAYTRNPMSQTDPSGLKESCSRNAYYSGGCPGDGGDVFFDDSQIIEGYTIFDAIAGVPGTYTYTDIYGQTSFGFSEVLWGSTENFIDDGTTGVPFPVRVDDGAGGETSATLANYYYFQQFGWNYDIRDLGAQTEVSSILLDALSLLSQYGELFQSDEAMQQAAKNHLDVTNAMVATILLNDSKFEQMQAIDLQLGYLLYPLLDWARGGFNSELVLPEDVPPPSITIQPGPMPNIPPPSVQIPPPPRNP